MNKLVTQLLATREGGAVKRCHVLPSNTEYTVASHSYNAVSLLLLLHPNPSLALIKAVQWHDVAERWMGDLPSIVKHECPELKAVYERIEEQRLRALGLAQDLTPEEKNWLKAVDTFECYLWVREEQRLGNQNLGEWKQNCEDALEDMEVSERLPRPVWDLFCRLRHVAIGRLSDFFNLVQGKTHEPRQVGGRLGEGPVVTASELRERTRTG